MNTKSLAAMQAEVADFCQAKGWNDQPVSFLEAMALLHTEVSEAVEAWREYGLDAWFKHTVRHDCLYCVTASQYNGTCNEHPAKPEGVGSELADVFIRLLDDCARFGIDLEIEYEQKMHYNRTRPYRHGGKRA